MRSSLSPFEPVHGSAPDIAGKGIANPIATLWCVQMMLDFLGEQGAVDDLMKAIEAVTASGFLTADLGGSHSTVNFTTQVIAQIERK